MDEDDPEEVRAHEAIWQKIYDAVGVVFSELQHQGMIGEEEYFVVEDDLGWDIVQTELVISPLWPQIARRFQLILADFPGWRITMQVLRNKADGWPGMGIIVSADGIKDELKRQFPPPKLCDMTFGVGRLPGRVWRAYLSTEKRKHSAVISLIMSADGAARRW